VKKKSGTKSNILKSSRTTKVFPDKAYDPMKLFRSQLADNNDKNAPKTMQREENVVNEDYNYPGPKKDRYSQIKSFLKKNRK